MKKKIFLFIVFFILIVIIMDYYQSKTLYKPFENNFEIYANFKGDAKPIDNNSYERKVYDALTKSYGETGSSLMKEYKSKNNNVQYYQIIPISKDKIYIGITMINDPVLVKDVYHKGNKTYLIVEYTTDRNTFLGEIKK